MLKDAPIKDKQKMNYLDIVEAKEVFRRGENVTQYLRKKFNEQENTLEIIEIAYDLQAGSYIKEVQANPTKVSLYADEIANNLQKHLCDGDTLLDVGTGELTTLTLLLNKVNTKLSEILAFDISWSRLNIGYDFFEKNRANKDHNVTTFVADIKEIPLHTKCVDLSLIQIKN